MAARNAPRRAFKRAPAESSAVEMLRPVDICLLTPTKRSPATVSSEYIFALTTTSRPL